MPRKPLGVLIVAAVVAACATDDPPVPTTVNVTPATVDFDAVGATQQLSATVLDQDGDPIAGANVTWSSGSQQIAGVDDEGLVTSAGNGTTQVTARAGTASDQATVNVDQVPTDAAPSGDAQSGLANSPLPTPIVVSVLDRLGSPIPGVPVMFTVTAGNGIANPPNTETDGDGEASTVWTLGPDLGANELAAEVEGFPSIMFTASAVLGDPEVVTPVAGDDQSATVNTAVAVAPSVRVTDGSGGGDPGLPIEGVMVTFAVASGGGSVTGEDQVTDADGIATVGSWTLGQVAGDNTLSANVSGADPGVITATGLADTPTQIVIATANPQQTAVDFAVPDPPGVAILDQFDNPVPGVDVDFAVISGGGMVTGSPATTGLDGVAQLGEWQVGGAVGTNEVEATAAAFGLGPVTFTAEALLVGPPASVVAFDGDGQTGLTGAPINFPPAVQVFDANMLAVPDAEVVFSVTSGGGMVTGETQMTDATGVATVGSWTIGAGANTLDATVTGGGIAGNPVMFDAMGIAAALDIEVMHVSAPTAPQAAAFDAAVAFWQELLIGDLPDGNVNLNANACGITHPALSGNVDDVVIFSVLEPIDGPSGVLGQAGPCLVRSASGLAIVGIMRFDTDDLDDLENDGELDEVILHEMGHVLGFGITFPGADVAPWESMLQNPSLPDPPGEDTHFDGPLAIKTFDLIGGDTYVGGGKVPVENEQGGTGTRDSHWRESVFNTELMTGFLDGGVPNPLSTVSVASLGDLGYIFNLSAAEAFVLPAAVPAPRASATRVPLVDDVWRGPLYVVNEAGRIVATLRR